MKPVSHGSTQWKREHGIDPAWKCTTRIRFILVVLLMICFAPTSFSYSVLTHEAITDAAWKDYIKPLLLQRFPNLTPEQLLQAHAYVYGGAIIQDLGYYPFGSRLFSDLTHYVRSGDFVISLIAESRDQNEYAFALGALAHYAADISGHPLATNRSVPLLYPKLQKKYGSDIPYEDNPSVHARVEFGFDVDHVAEGNYAPSAYHNFIGFKVSKPLLERAFSKTYSLNLSDICGSVDMSLGSYRYAVSKVIPRMTKVAWHLKKKEIENSHPNETKQKFIYNISKSEYRDDWGDVYEKPSFFARFKALFSRVIPKVGPFSTLAFHPPTPAVEQIYMHSFNETLALYEQLLIAQRDGALQLPNKNLDTGEPTEAGAYHLTDKTYAKLLGELNGKSMPSALRRNILDFYADLGKPIETKKNPKEWRNVLQELAILKTTSEAATGEPRLLH
jgi:hypothetical protein